jgi:hypothetical protein
MRIPDKDTNVEAQMAGKRAWVAHLALIEITIMTNHNFIFENLYIKCLWLFLQFDDIHGSNNIYNWTFVFSIDNFSIWISGSASTNQNRVGGVQMAISIFNTD